jgi:hypothetical protein
MRGWIGALKQQLPSLDPKDLLPLGVEIKKGAIVVGNQYTPTLLVIDFKSTEGTYGIVPVRIFLFDPLQNVYSTTQISGEVTM